MSEQEQLNSADFQAGEEAAQAAAPQPIASDLVASVGSLRAIATAHNLLDTGMFPHAKAEAVRLSLDFLRSLHEQMKAQALQHPEADRVPELQALKGDV